MENQHNLKRTCKIHGKSYYYTCPDCLKPYLKATPFSSLEEIRHYQQKMAKEINQKDVIQDYQVVVIIKIKFQENLAHVGYLRYSLVEKKILTFKMRSLEPIFTKYFPSVLFLNQSDLYLKIINELEQQPDCYILNSSGRIHPFLYGLACGVGREVNIPVFGYTESLLFGISIKDNNSTFLKILHEGEIIGMGIPRPKSKKYYYISVGNNISLESAVRVFLAIDFSVFSELKKKINKAIQERKQEKNKKDQV
ncbi:MAG: endonuclease V [Promethearchaeota archaeon]